MSGPQEEPVTLDAQDIAEILRIFADSGLEELSLEVGETRLHVSKNAGAASPFAPPAGAPTTTRAVAETPAASAAPAVPSEAAAAVPSEPAAGTSGADAVADGAIDVASPLLGVYYSRPAPDQPAFVEVGSEVAAGDPVCIIDVMKMFTRVPAGVAGTVVEILAQDGALIEHGQTIMRIRPR